MPAGSLGAPLTRMASATEPPSPPANVTGPAAALGAGAVAAAGADAGAAVFVTTASWQPALRAPLPNTQSHIASARGANRPIMPWSLPFFSDGSVGSARARDGENSGFRYNPGDSERSTVDQA